MVLSSALFFPFHAIKNGSLFSFRLPQRSYVAVRIISLYVRLLNSYSWSYFGRDMAILSLSTTTLLNAASAKLAHTNHDCLGSLSIFISCVRIVLICFYLPLLSFYDILCIKNGKCWLSCIKTWRTGTSLWMLRYHTPFWLSITFSKFSKIFFESLNESQKHNSLL